MKILKRRIGKLVAGKIIAGALQRAAVAQRDAELARPAGRRIRPCLAVDLCRKRRDLRIAQRALTECERIVGVVGERDRDAERNAVLRPHHIVHLSG